LLATRRTISVFSVQCILRQLAVALTSPLQQVDNFRVYTGKLRGNVCNGICAASPSRPSLVWAADGIPVYSLAKNLCVDFVQGVVPRRPRSAIQDFRIVLATS